MGIRGAVTVFRDFCNSKGPGSAAQIFRRVDFEQGNDHFSKHDGTACVAATAYILPDLHFQPWLAEPFFNKGAYEQWVYLLQMLFPGRRNVIDLYVRMYWMKVPPLQTKHIDCAVTGWSGEYSRTWRS